MPSTWINFYNVWGLFDKLPFVECKAGTQNRRKFISIFFCEFSVYTCPSPVDQDGQSNSNNHQNGDQVVSNEFLYLFNVHQLCDHIYNNVIYIMSLEVGCTFSVCLILHFREQSLCGCKNLSRWRGQLIKIFCHSYFVHFAKKILTFPFTVYEGTRKFF